MVCGANFLAGIIRTIGGGVGGRGKNNFPFEERDEAKKEEEEASRGDEDDGGEMCFSSVRT